jgi:membrane protein
MSEHSKTIARLDREGEHERGELAGDLAVVRSRIETWRRRAAPWAAAVVLAAAAAGAGLAVSALVRRATRSRPQSLLARVARSVRRTKLAARKAKKRVDGYRPRPIPVTLLLGLLRTPTVRRALVAGGDRLLARSRKAGEAAPARDAEKEPEKRELHPDRKEGRSDSNAPAEVEGEKKARHTLKELKEASFREKLRFGAHLFRDALRAFKEDEGLTRAAALAYYAVFSLAPILIIVVAVAGLAFGADAVRDRILAQIGKLVGSDAAAAVASLMQKASKPSSGILATIVGVATLLFGAGGVFGSLQETLNKFWRVPKREGSGLWNALRSRFLSLAMVLGTGFLLLVSLVVSAALSAVGDTVGTEHSPVVGLLFNALHTVVSFAVVGLLFALIFRYLPDTRIAWRDVWIGAAFTSLLFALGQFLIGLYLGRSAVASVYGGAGAIAIVLLWTYYSGLVLFFGAEITRVFASQWGSKR